MNVLSLFDGMSCGQIALKKLGIEVTNYLACEIDPHAIAITQKNFPKTIQLGDVTKVHFNNGYILSDKVSKFVGNIDLIIGGSPCQGFSFAGKQLNFKDPRSALFFEFVRLKKEIQASNPSAKFFMENVRMKKEYLDVISEKLEIEPIFINSALVSAQSRQRYYWTNLDNISQPADKGIMLKDIVFADVFPVALHNLYGGFNETMPRVFEHKSPTLRTAAGGGHIPSFVYKTLIHSERALAYMDREVNGGRNHWDFAHHSDINNSKSATVVANFFKGVPYNVFKDWNCIRKFHPIECERLQTVPDGYTEGVSDTQRYRMLGNGWTVDVIAHLFQSLKNYKRSVLSHSAPVVNQLDLFSKAF